MNIRTKKKNISKVLASIAISSNNINNKSNDANINVDNYQISSHKLSQDRLFNVNNQQETKNIKAFQRNYRYYKVIHNIQKESSMFKYQSLQLNRKKNRKSNQSRYNLNNSIENSPYKPIRSKKSLNNFQDIKQPNSKVNRLLYKLNQNATNKHKSIDTININKNISRKNMIMLSQKQQQQFENNPKGQYKIEQLRQKIRLLMMSQQNNQQVLELLKNIKAVEQTDLQLLQLKGLSLLNIKNFKEALEYFYKIIQINKYYNKNVYVYISLCQNQLHHPQKCLKYIEQCMTLFPSYYEPFYFKGKLYMKQHLYNDALEWLIQASKLNNTKKDIKMMIGQCYEKTGRINEAIIYYSKSINQINHRNIKWALRHADLLILQQRNFQAVCILQKCLNYTEIENIKMKQINFDASQLYYLLMLAYFKQNSFDLAYMKGQQILSISNQIFLSKIIRIMLTCNLKQKKYHQMLYLYQKTQYLNLVLKNIDQYIMFIQALQFLIKNKIQQAILKFQQLSLFFSTLKNHNQFNIYIYKVLKIFLYYSYFIVGRYNDILLSLKIPKQINHEIVDQSSIKYIQMICNAYKSYNNKDLSKTHQILLQIKQSYPHAKEIQLYLAIVLFKIYFDSKDQDKKKIINSQINQYLNNAVQQFKFNNSNYSAFIYYYRGLFYAWSKQFGRAACDLDIAIEKSEDNFAMFYYLRALIFVNLQNYKQAISEISIAISLDQSNTDFYEFRARCFQIDGDSNEAFSDLQACIALKPDDENIHKLAGHLLFENGAFEDALQAYNQGQNTQKDIEVFLTRSKTYFLMGNFIKASQDLLQIVQTTVETFESKQYYFDYQIMKWLSELLSQYIKNQTEDNYQFNKQTLLNNVQQLQKIYCSNEDSAIQNNNDNTFGKIFKLIDFFIFLAACSFYFNKYDKAIQCFMKAIDIKRQSVTTDQPFEQDEVQKLSFINQMFYNLAICYLMLNDIQKAKMALNQCKISKDLHTYQIHDQLINQITGMQEVNQNEKYLDLFSMRNKLSRYLPSVAVPFQSIKTNQIHYRKMKICIPYPKVQPPEITPKLNPSLLTNIDLNKIERRLDAPWINKQKNSIKFTDKIDTFSRFELQKSQKQKQEKKQYIFESFCESDIQTAKDLRKKLKLDSKVEQKLNKLLKNK